MPPKSCGHLPLARLADVPFIYHIATVPDWERARRAGEYTASTRGRTLAQEGFIHASSAEQTGPAANRFYAGAGEPLVVLVIDTGRLTAALQYDEVPGSPEPFPHIYGPLNLDAVTEVLPFAPGPDGAFTFDPAGGPARPG